jgi:tetratricopeptide (TPR) repeat protein/predicted Ser/Thr protein kinase
MDAGMPATDEHAGPRDPLPTRTMVDEELEALRTADPSMPHRIGRYTIVRRLGAGGMGTVWSAYDESLDRKVAIKVLVSERTSDASRVRMIREARALARLSDPNVVQIFEVGELGDDVFVAMEFVRGPTLRRWLEQSREMPEILDAFIQAGRGLAAVHGARLVHRDFKPDNVVVGDDGRVRLVDFGIARFVDDARESDERGLSQALSSGEMDVAIDRVTRTGQFVGTPAFMAPEQMRGEPVDARADQFAFCVSLFRAAYGIAPFAGEKVGAIALNVFAGRITDPPKSSRKVPAGLLPILRRGMSVARGDRFADMPELLAALERLRPRRGPLRAIAVAAIAGAGVTAAVVASDRNECDGGTDTIAAVWNWDRAAEIGAGFGDAGAEAAWTRAAASLDRTVESWIVQHRDACERHRRGEQSATLLDRRMSCLDEKKVELAALLDELGRFDPALVTVVQDAVDALSSVDACGDLQRLAATQKPEPPPQIAAAVEEGFATIRRAEAQERTGRVGEARTTLETRIADLDALDWPRLSLEAHALAATVAQSDGRQADAEREFRETFKLAVAQQDDERAFESASSLIVAIGVQQGRFADVSAWIDVSEAWVRKRGNLPFDRAVWLEAVAGVREREGRGEEARELLEQALVLMEGEADDPHFIRLYAGTLNALGLVNRQLRRLDEAAEAYRKAHESWIALLGEEHPLPTDPLNNLGTVYLDLGRYDDARRTWHEVLATRERIFGRRHPKVAHILHNLGSAADKMGDHHGAIAHYREAFEILEEAFGPNDPAVATPAVTIGESYIAMGEHARAVPYIRRALAIDTAAFGGDDHADVAWDMNALATALNGVGEYAEAQRLARRAMEVRRVRASADRVGQSRFQLGLALAGLGRMDEARAEVDRAEVEAAGDAGLLAAIAAWKAERRTVGD